jgi:hypothetical protein
MLIYMHNCISMNLYAHNYEFVKFLGYYYPCNNPTIFGLGILGRIRFVSLAPNKCDINLGSLQLGLAFWN